jgi:hypothetical protein
MKKVEVWGMAVPRVLTMPVGLLMNLRGVGGCVGIQSNARVDYLGKVQKGGHGTVLTHFRYQPLPLRASNICYMLHDEYGCVQAGLNGTHAVAWEKKDPATMVPKNTTTSCRADNSG